MLKKLIKRQRLLLIGAGGHMKSVVDSIQSKNDFTIAGFIDSNVHMSYRNYKVIGQDEDLKKFFDLGITNAFICIGYLGKGDLRNILYEKIVKIGFTIPTVIDSSAIIAKDVSIEEGVFIGKNVVVNSNAKIHKMAIVNTGAIIEHDCNIGDFSHIAVNSVLCGDVTIGKNCLIGANATIIQGRTVGDNSIIGAGETLKTDIEENRIINSKY